MRPHRRDEKKEQIKETKNEENKEEKKEPVKDIKKTEEGMISFILDEQQAVVKGRGFSRFDESRSLFGWDEEDYLKVNRKLIESGQKFKSNFYKRKNNDSRRVRLNIIYQDKNTLGKGKCNYLLKLASWRHDKFNDVNLSPEHVRFIKFRK